MHSAEFFRFSASRKKAEILSILIYSPGFKTKREKQNNKSHVEQEKKKAHKITFFMRRKFLEDIDECQEDTDGCSQLCINNDGSFTCSCNSGYRLKSDKKTCEGK